MGANGASHGTRRRLYLPHRRRPSGLATRVGLGSRLLLHAPPSSEPLYKNTCYSFVSDTDAVHVVSMHHYDATRKTMLPAACAGGVSVTASDLEGHHALAWARAIWADSLG